MKRTIFYPPCKHLDPNTRNFAGHYYCAHKMRYVKPATTVLTAERRAHLFNPSSCAPDCPNRSGKTRMPTL